MSRPRLTIHQRRDRVTFRNVRGDEVELRLDDALAVRSAVRGFVEKVNKRVGWLAMDPEVALRMLKELSEAAYHTLVDSTQETFRVVAERWNEVMSWLRVVQAPRAGEPPSTGHPPFPWRHR